MSRSFSEICRLVLWWCTSGAVSNLPKSVKKSLWLRTRTTWSQMSVRPRILRATTAGLNARSRTLHQNCEALADNMHVRSQIASLWAGHDAAFALFLYLLFVDRTMDFCSVKHVKARFGEMKKEIEAEMRMYFDESGFDGAMQMAKVKHFLDSVVDISPNVMAFRTTTQLYIEMYKMKKKT
ncbi:hypothetical protein L596_025094 [Steinernema carpocapsae]|uniref:Uncharacterized protein n=1 Tax=Steinernema carpocapsae TaxID=34508 RepID=A0A4U5M6T1_STECR|nr:hypothetical protein L596_025094 [Steinernema carpocapsae]